MDVKTKRALQGEETRKQLLDIAAALFAARGYGDTSLEQVAAEAGVTKGALYHHFRDKTALFEAALARHVRGLGKSAQRLSKRRVLEAGGRRRGFERIEAALAAFLDQLCDPTSQRLVLVDGPAVLGRTGFDRVWTESSLPGIRRVLGPLDDSPGLPDGLVEPVSRLVLGAVHEAALAIAHSDDPDARPRFECALLWTLQAVREKALDEASGSLAE